MKRAVLVDLLNKLGPWVQMHSDDTEAQLLSSGFDLAKKRVPVGVLAKPVNFNVKPGDTVGKVKVLTSGSEYVFKAVAIAANPTRVYSDLVSTFVL